MEALAEDVTAKDSAEKFKNAFGGVAKLEDIEFVP